METELVCACLGQFALLHQLLQLLVDEGPKFGYFPEPDKSYLVVHPDFVEEVKYHFKDFKINIVTGQRFMYWFPYRYRDLDTK